MRLKSIFTRFAIPAVFSCLAIISIVISAEAQSDTNPATIHSVCSGNCVADTNFLHSGMSDSSARGSYHGWYSSYYDLAECSQSAWQTDILFLMDVVGDAIGSPGGATMQCWQGLAAQAANCSKSCSDYFIPDAKYAPNVEVSLASAGAGSLEVLLDNGSNMGNLPELEPNAYSRRFGLFTTLQRDSGQKLLFNSTEIGSLSYPNWITRGGYDDCVSGYGAEDDRCKLLEYFNIPSTNSLTISSYDGVLYDLTDQVYNLSDANGSFSQDGYIRLLSDGDSITIKQGPYAGFAWVKTHNISGNSHTQYAFPWDASDHDVTIQNDECTTWFFCGGSRNETDTYVFATRGPIEKVLAGTYTVESTATIPHEKVLSDNTVSYSYESEDAGNTQAQENGEIEEQEQVIPISSIPIIDLPGPGEYTNSVIEGLPGIMYRLQVPDDISFIYLQTFTLTGAGAEIFINHGSLPVPNFPAYNNGEYDRLDFSNLEWSGSLAMDNPLPGEMYIFVAPLQNGENSFRLNLEWTIREPDSSQTETESLTTEMEPNDSAATANVWQMSQPFTGQISKWNDKDHVQLNFAASGIYTFTLSDTGDELKAKLALVKKIHDNSSLTLVDANAGAPGEAVSLNFDASAGETYYLKISAIGMPSDTLDQPYRLELTGFIPDPYESNDDKENATPWDVSNAVQGYFWDRVNGNADFYTFIAPSTMNGSPLVFTVSNPSPDIRIRLSLTRSNGVSIGNSSFMAPGEPAILSIALEPNQQYYLKLDVMSEKTSLQPYQLSATYAPDINADDNGPLIQLGSHEIRIHGRVYRQWAILQIPLREVEIYIQVDRQPALLLDTTKGFGTFDGTIYLKEGQLVDIWALREGFLFEPQMDAWTVTADEQNHQSKFVAVEGYGPLDYDLVTPEATEMETLQTNTLTPTAVPVAINNSIDGTVWRLFSSSEPAGIGAARLLLTINGREQPVVYSMIDGTYTIRVSGLQAGDQLSLKAENPEDRFEPSSYDWIAEAGAENYVYDFFSYWENSGTAEEISQNHLYGRVTDSSGQGVAGINLVLRIGESDALQLLGPTDANGYYDALIDLPSRMMVTLWVEESGYSPSRIQFFHAYATENRELNFKRPPASTE